MDLIGFCVADLLFLLGIVTQLIQPSSAAEFSPPITCSVTQQHHGTFLYHLSQPPVSSRCTTCWEDHNKTVIARNADHVPNLVQTLTNQSIVLKSCLEHLTYIRDCSGLREDAHCSVNCSSFLDQHPPPQPSVNSTLIRFSKTWCGDQLTCGLIIGGIVVAVVMVGLILFVIFKYFKHRRTANSPVSYTPAAMIQIMIGK